MNPRREIPSTPPAIRPNISPRHKVTFRGISKQNHGIETLGGSFPDGRQGFMPLGGGFIYSTGDEYGQVTCGPNGNAHSIPRSGGSERNAGITRALYEDAGYPPPVGGVQSLRDI